MLSGHSRTAGYAPPCRGRTYTPDANYNGSDSFSYLLSDGPLNSNIATVSLDVASVNDAPTGTSTTVTTLEDTSYVFQAADFGYSDAVDALSTASANNFAGAIVDSVPAV